MRKIDGKVIDCRHLSSSCLYRCCDQDKPDGQIKICHENYIMLYPGEWEAAEKSKVHIEIVNNDFFGGKLGRCRREDFDQPNCNPSKNFKSMDCQAYPFAPSFDKNGNLRLEIDKRCPMKASRALDDHYHTILEKWKSVIEKDNSVIAWIRSFELGGYVEYKLKISKHRKSPKVSIKKHRKKTC